MQSWPNSSFSQDRPKYALLTPVWRAGPRFRSLKRPRCKYVFPRRQLPRDKAVPACPASCVHSRTPSCIFMSGSLSKAWVSACVERQAIACGGSDRSPPPTANKHKHLTCAPGSDCSTGRCASFFPSARKMPSIAAANVPFGPNAQAWRQCRLYTAVASERSKPQVSRAIPRPENGRAGWTANAPLR